MLKIGWFSTGRSEGSRRLLEVVHDSIEKGEINGELSFVFSNREQEEYEGSDLFFNLVNSYHIPLVCLSSKKFAASSPNITAIQQDGILPHWRSEYDREIMRRLKVFTPDICVLAGYMLIVGNEMCQQYDMINLHPALPSGPKGTWQEVIWMLIENKAKETGAMMHLVTPELDRGPVITYYTFYITGSPFDEYWQEIGERPIVEVKKEQGESNNLFKLIRQHGLAREFPLIVSTLKAFSHGKIKIVDGKLLDDGDKPINGYDLSNEINKMVEG